MQALILAAGMGRRLGEYTKHQTKCMVEVGGKPLIQHALETLDGAGIEKLILVVGYQGDQLRELLGQRQGNVEIQYVTNPIFDRTNNIYSLFLAHEHLLQDDTLLLESDLIYEPGIVQGVLRDSRPDLAVVDRYQSWMDGTVVTLDDEDNIVSFIPKKSMNLDDVDDYFKTVNIYKFSREFSRSTYVPFLKAYSSALGNNEYYEQVLKVIATLDAEGLKGYRLTGEKWYEIDEPQDKENAETIFTTSPAEKLRRIAGKHGGYWRYPQLTDFCYLVNPFFPTPRLEGEMKSRLHDLLSHYPSGMQEQQMLAGQLFDISPDNIVVGNGASELIRELAAVLDGNIGIVHPTFNEYAESFADRVVSLAAPGEDFSYTIQDLALLSERCNNVLIINPDNPSGHYIAREDVLELAEWLQSRGKRLIVDESFVDFCDRAGPQTLVDRSVLSAYPNLIVIKSLGKSYGVPGTRLGVLATANRAKIKALRARLPIWNVGSFGEFFLQIIGKHQADYLDACEQAKQERNWLVRALQATSFLRVLPSQANYLMCEVVEGFSATELTETLLDRYDILIKDLTSKTGLDGGQYVRIAVRNREDNLALRCALRDLEGSLRRDHADANTESMSVLSTEY